MAGWFYTDAMATQQGPVDDLTLLSLARAGEVKAGSLVWEEGMESWVAFKRVAGSIFARRDGREQGPVEIGVCAHSGQVYPLADMLPYGEAHIGPDHKDEFVQNLMEKAITGVIDATKESPGYVGFWWRTLAALLDYMIKMIPAGICMIPYYAAAMAQGVGSGGEEEAIEGLTGWTGLMLAAYGLGMLGNLGVSIFYETWMVGKHQATLGKLIIGAKVVNPDGSRLTYKRAFIRWLAKKPLNYLIVWIPSALGLGIVIGVTAAASRGAGDDASGIMMALIAGMIVYVSLLSLCSAVYWMAAFDPEKRALHDRVASTRVVKK